MAKAGSNNNDADSDRAAEQIKKAKVRSPNYPVVGLGKAVELMVKLNNKFGKHPIPVALVLKEWDYAPESSVGNQNVAALKAYGLIDVNGIGDARRITISKEGLRIAGSAPDRQELLRKSALAPKIHADIMEHYAEHGLPDDALLKQYLVWDRPEGQRFNPDSVGEFIGRFRDTLAYAGVVSGDETEKNEEKPPTPKAKTGDYVQWTAEGVDQFVKPRRVVWISDDAEFVRVDGNATGIPMSELTLADPPAPRTSLEDDLLELHDLSEEAAKQNRVKVEYVLDEGKVVLVWPDELSKESFDDFEYWIKGLLRRARRKAGLPAESSGVE